MAMEQELKQAILNLPGKEKIKLLLKLINKDAVLVKQLHYQLIDGPDSLDERHVMVSSKKLSKYLGYYGEVCPLVF